METEEQKGWKEINADVIGFRGIKQTEVKLKRNEVTLVIGPNGSGKTSLLEAVRSLTNPVASERKKDQRNCHVSNDEQSKVVGSTDVEDRKTKAFSEASSNYEVGQFPVNDPVLDPMLIMQMLVGTSAARAEAWGKACEPAAEAERLKLYCEKRLVNVDSCVGYTIEKRLNDLLSYARHGKNAEGNDLVNIDIMVKKATDERLKFKRLFINLNHENFTADLCHQLDEMWRGNTESEAIVVKKKFQKSLERLKNLMTILEQQVVLVDEKRRLDKNFVSHDQLSKVILPSAKTDLIKAKAECEKADVLLKIAKVERDNILLVEKSDDPLICPQCKVKLRLVDNTLVGCTHEPVDMEEVRQERLAAMAGANVKISELEGNCLKLTELWEIAQLKVQTVELGDERYISQADALEDILAKQEQSGEKTDEEKREIANENKDWLEMTDQARQVLRETLEEKIKDGESWPLTLQIRAYNQIIQIFGPNGYIKDHNQAFQQKVAKYLKIVTNIFGWHPITLDVESWEVKMQNLQYKMLSESERWKVRLALQIALSRITESQVLFIDGVDVLDRKSLDSFWNQILGIGQSEGAKTPAQQLKMAIMCAASIGPEDVPVQARQNCIQMKDGVGTSWKA